MRAPAAASLKRCVARRCPHGSSAALLPVATARLQLPWFMAFVRECLGLCSCAAAEAFGHVPSC